MRLSWRTPVGRGFVMLAVMSAAFGFALNAQQTIVTNFFDEVLGLQGPQFGYMTAIREVPGFLLIFLTALFYRVSLQRLTAAALVLMAVGFALYGFATSFWTVVPWVIIGSMGYHTVFQTQYSLGMSLTTESKSGGVLGLMAAVGQGGTLVALGLILVVFHFDLVSYQATFAVLGAIAFVGALAIFGFPHLHEGEARAAAPRRAPMVWRRQYRYYYLLSILDGGRQQILFSFGLWVLVSRFGLSVSQVTVVLLAVTFVSMASAPRLGRMIDRQGERRMLSAVNLAYVVALGGYALAGNVVVAALCYVLYSFIMPLSSIGAATYLRKVAAPEEIAPSLAMGVTLQHATAIVVPVAAGFILNFVGYQVPFLIACGFACITFVVTRRLDHTAQRSPARIAADEARLGAAGTGAAAAALAGAEGGGAAGYAVPFAAENAAAAAQATLMASDGGVAEEFAAQATVSAMTSASAAGDAEAGER